MTQKADLPSVGCNFQAKKNCGRIYLIVLLSMLGVSRLSRADDKATSCRASLPIPIRQLVETTYKDWHVASAEMLNHQDRERFKPFIANDCYGVIRGHFTNEGISYALYLLKPNGEGYINQLVVFQEAKGGLNHYVLIPAGFAASAVVLRKVPLGTPIIDINTGKHFLPPHDVVNVLDPDKGEISFFWKAGKFISVTTSE